MIIYSLGAIKYVAIERDVIITNLLLQAAYRDRLWQQQRKIEVALVERDLFPFGFGGVRMKPAHQHQATKNERAHMTPQALAHHLISLPHLSLPFAHIQMEY